MIVGAVDMVVQALSDYMQEDLWGIRALTDFELEFKMASINKIYTNNVETIFLPTKDDQHFISSSVVKEIAKYGTNLLKSLPYNVEIWLKKNNPSYGNKI